MAGEKNMRRSQNSTKDDVAGPACPDQEAGITIHDSRITILPSLLTNHHSRITPFLIGSSAIRNRCNQMKTNGGIPFQSVVITGFGAHVSSHFAHKSCAHRPAQKPQVMHWVIHAIHKAPVDITVDKGSSSISEKAQQNQHFKYHRLVPSLYHDANTVLIATVMPNYPAPPPSAPNITLIWNMHRSGAACSLNVTSVGICLSRKQCVVTAFAPISPYIPPPPLTRPKCRSIVNRTFGMLVGPRAGVFPGTS